MGSAPTHLKKKKKDRVFLKTTVRGLASVVLVKNDDNVCTRISAVLYSLESYVDREVCVFSSLEGVALQGSL